MAARDGFGEIFFNTNQKTAIAVAQARRFDAHAKKQAMQLFEYTPLQVKQAIVGYGRRRSQVIAMVSTILEFEAPGWTTPPRWRLQSAMREPLIRLQAYMGR